MKKILISMLLACILLTVCCGALAEAAFTVTPNPPAGINYSYKYNVVMFKDGETTAFMDKYIYDKLVVPAEAVDGDIYVALEDLKKIYAPDFTVTTEGDAISINHVGLTAVISADKAEATFDGNAYTFKNAPKTVDGILMVPAFELMNVAFAKETKMIGNFYGVAYSTSAISSSYSARSVGLLEEALAGRKTTGFVYLTYTIEDDPDQKILPVRLYIPYCYDPEKPMRTILVLHGNSVSQDYFWTDTRANIKAYKPFETYAEENGYIIITASAYMVAGNYGDVENLPYMTATTWDPIDDAEKELRMRSEKSVMTALELVKSLYNVDEEHLYLMGNSMGGKGTLFLGNKYADMWDAIVPMAMMPNMSLVPVETYSNLVDMPLLFVEGTEDNYGFERAKQNYEILAEYLNNEQHYWSAGGGHSTAWAMALPQIFEFLNAQ